MSRRSLLCAGASAAIGLAVAVGAGAAGTAVAAPASGAIAISADGVTYSDVLAGSLFGDLGTIVPMDHSTRQLWVRNDSASTVVLRVNAVDVLADDAAYADALTLRATTAVQSTRAAMPFSTNESCYQLLGEQYLAAGASVPVTFDLAMGDVDGTTAQGAIAGATLVVQFRDAAAPAPADGDCDGDGVHLAVLGGTSPSAPAGASGSSIGSLSSTGADPLLWGLASLSLLVGGWIAFVATRRKRSEP